MKLDHRLLRLAGARQAGFLFSIGLGLLGSGLVVWQSSLLSAVIGRVFLAGDTLQQVGAALIGLLGVICLRAVAVWGAEALAELTAVGLKEDLRSKLIDHMLALGPGFARVPELQAGQPGSAEEVHTVLEGVEALHAYFSHYLPQIALSALVPLILLIFIFPLDLLSALVLLLTAPLIPLFMVLIGSAAEILTRRQWGLLSRLSGYFHDILNGLATLKSLGQSQGQAKVVAEASERYRQVTMQVLRVTFLSAFALELVATISTAVVAVEIGLRLLYGRLSFEQALFVLVLAPEFYLPLRMLGARFHAGLAGVAAAAHIYAILDVPLPQVFASPESFPPEMEPQKVRGEVRFDQVTFTYPDGRQAVRAVSFILQPGQMLALVGPSGSGKSTLASLLLGFLAPQAGRVLVDGRPLHDRPARDWISQVAWVPQTPTLFHATVSANIRLARPTASDEEVRAAARLAQAHEFIDRLPQGYATMVGERGARLSAGQAQRIALARAYLKDAPVLVLDEPTSFLDPQNEFAIRQALEGLVASRTTLIIAHRLSTTSRADQILVLENGRIREQGTHAELAQRGELYPRLLAAYRGAARQIRERPLFETRTSFAPPHPGVARIGMPAVTRSPEIQIAEGPARWGGSLRRLLELLAPFKSWMALAALLGFLTVGSGIGLMATSAYIISAAALQPSIAVLQVPIVGVRFFGLARALARYLERYTSHQVTLRVLARLRVWFYRALEPLAPARLLAYRGGDLVSRATADIAVLEDFFVRALAPPLVALLAVAVMLVFLLSFHWRLALAALGGYLLAGLGLPLWMRQASRGSGRRLAERRAALHADLVETLLGLADLVLAGQVESCRERLGNHVRRLADAQREMAYLTAWQAAWQVGLANLAMWAVLSLAIPLVGSGSLAGVHLAVLALAVLASFEAFAPLTQAAQFLGQQLASAERLFEMVDVPPAVDLPAAPVGLPDSHDLHLEGVSFTYPVPWGEAAVTASAPALQDLSFDLPQGKRLAIVGPSGAGKSSLVNILLRFWEYQLGEISLAGRSLREYDPEQLRACWGVVSQNTYLFNASLADNLRLARPNASQAALESAARLAEIHDFIQGLPSGYGTWAGEVGSRLSGGERQRLAIARALLKDPPLLILDEATANLDPLTEQRIMSRILHDRWQPGRQSSLLWISHRLVEMEQMDEILVLEAGRVVARGTHRQLLAEGGLYRQLWHLQNQAVLE